MLQPGAFGRIRRTGTTAIWLMASCLGVSACGAAEDLEPAGSAPAAVDRWALSEDPVTVIGVVEGPPEYELFRVSGAFRLSDGRTVVVNTGTNELRYYDWDGTWLRSSGRTGKGPGEFDRLTCASAIHGDTVVAWDEELDRVTVFDPDGEVTDDFVIRLEGHRVQLAGYTSQAYPGHILARRDGVILVVSQAPRWLLRGLRTTADGYTVAQKPDSIPPNGVYRIEHSLYIVDRDGKVATVVPEMVGGLELMVGANGWEQQCGSVMTSTWPPVVGSSLGVLENRSRS